MGDTVVVHVGQCGVQIGASFWNQLRQHQCEKMFDNGYSSSKSADQHFARAVLVDSEPKPAAAAQNAGWMFRPESIVCEQSGRANNWSCGYMASADLLERASDAVRKEIERCASLTGLMTK